MNRSRTGVAVLLLVGLALAGCSSSSSGPDESGPSALDIPGLVTFYEFDGNLADASGNGLDAESRRAISYVEDHNGTAGAALYVASAADSVYVADCAELDITGALSVAAWVNAGLGTTMYGCFADKGYADGAWSVGTNSAVAPMRKPLYLYIGTHTHSFELNEAIPAGQDQWVHFVCCFNDTTDETTFYIDGAYAFTDTAGVPVTLGVTDLDLRIGCSNYADAFMGAIDQLALFNRELTADEVELLYEHD